MDPIGTIRGVLFDLDHTLTDREQSLRNMAEHLRKTYTKSLRPCSTEDLFTAFQRFDARGYRGTDKFCADLIKNLPWKNPPELAELVAFWGQNIARFTVERPGAKNVLQQLRSRGLRMGLVSNGTAEHQNAKVDSLGFGPLFDFVIVSGAVGLNKPDERIYQLALEKLKLPAAQVVFVGDHPINDVIIPQRVGMSVVWITGVFDWPTGYPAPAFAIQNLQELPGLF